LPCMLAKLARWWITVLAGVLIGGGLVLHGQVALARYLRQQVTDTFFLWKAIGNATFFLQSNDHRLALSLAEVPADVIDESDRAGWTLVIVGSLLAVCAPLLRRPASDQP